MANFEIGKIYPIESFVAGATKSKARIDKIWTDIHGLKRCEFTVFVFEGIPFSKHDAFIMKDTDGEYFRFEFFTSTYFIRAI